MHTALITCAELRNHLNDSDWIIVDCRFDLDHTEAGTEGYAQAHIPRAVYAHLDRDLSSSPVTDSGRHPLPSPDAMQRTFERLGISDGSQVVIYDYTQGMYACRLWWMLRYMGHDAVAVLDGGFGEWVRNGGPTRAGEEHNPPGSFHAQLHSEWLVVKSQVPGVARLVDARGGTRYRGEIEHRDPRAGHIPGALNYPWRSNIGGDGRFLPPEVIGRQLTEARRGSKAEDTAFYCGSGVTACVDVFATFLAGLGVARVYAGSWSEWSRDPSLPIATGDD